MALVDGINNFVQDDLTTVLNLHLLRLEKSQGEGINLMFHYASGRCFVAAKQINHIVLA